MRVARRSLLGGGAALLTAAMLADHRAIAQDAAATARGLKPLTGGVQPISRAERAGRLARAQQLMQQNGIGAVLVEPGSSMIYFSDIHWGRSERLTALILPAEGEIGVVTPFFEESRLREQLGIPAEVRTWHEHEDPHALVAGFLRDRKLAGRPVGIEDTVRWFAVGGLRSALPDTRIVSATPVIDGCRLIKSPAEIALMQVANDITLAAYRHTWPQVRAGMRQDEVQAIMDAAQRALGAETAGGGTQVGAGSALPHGSKVPETVAEGRVVLMDCACTVQGYWSDISRTFVFGEPTRRQREVWDQMHRGQQVAFEAARLGAAAGSVDDAVRAYYRTLGYGPDYRLPGLSHRTGHGIGLDVHEPINLVRGEKTPLSPGMCFSNEPGIYAPGQFGIRLEDCIHMTEAGPAWFTTPPPSIDRPLG